MKKYLIIVTLCCAVTSLFAVKRGPSIGSGYSPPTKVGPQPSFASQNLATSQFQTNISHIDVNQNGTKTISKPGQYYLSSDLAFHPIKNQTSSIIFHITTHNVTLDLNNKMVSQATGNNTLNMVAIKIDPNLHNITIRNGSIGNLSGQGITIGEGCSNITLHSLHITRCTQGSIVATGTTDSPIKTCNIYNSFLSHNNGNPSSYGDAVNTYDALGAKLSFVQHFLIDSCGFTNNETDTIDPAYGLYLDQCVSGTITNCSFTLNKAKEEAYGLFAQRCKMLEIFSCKFIGNQSIDEEAYGIALYGSNNNRIYRCEALGNQGKKDTFGFWAQGFEVTILVSGVPVTTYYGAHHNSFVECESLENTSVEEDAFGFYSSGNKANAFVHSLAQGNTSGTNASTTAAGICVANITIGATTYAESLFSVDHCYIKGNIAPNGTGAGILITAAENGHIDSNWILNNTGGDASYGIIDQTTDSSTLIMNNFAFGHTKNYSANYSESNADIPVASASIGDFRPLNVATAFSNLEWRETPNENLNS